MANVADELIKEIDKITDEQKISVAIDELSAQAQKEAIEVIKFYDEVKEQLDNFKKQKKRESLQRKMDREEDENKQKALQAKINSISAITFKKEQISQIYENFMELNKRLFKFQSTMLRVIKKEIPIAIVDDDGQIYEYSEDVFLENFADFFRIDVDSKTHNLKLRFKQAIVNNQKAKFTNSKEQVNIQKTYNEVQYRASVFKANTIKNISKVLILWKKNMEWDGTWADSMGDIDEAYLNFSYHKFKDFSNNPGHRDVEIFMDHPELGVMSVDSTAGRLVGDFGTDNAGEFGEDSQVEIAAKSIGASMVGYSQLIKMANKIKAMDVSKIKEFISSTRTSDIDKGAKKKHAKKFIEGTIDKKTETITDEMLELVQNGIENRI